MERFWETVKKRPMLIGVSVLVVVLIIWWMSRGSNSETQPTVGYVGPSSAATQANAALQIADKQAQSQMAQIQAMLEAEKDKSATQLAAIKDTNASQLSALSQQLAAQKAATDAQAGILSNQAAILGQLETHKADISQTISLATIAAQLAGLNANANSVNLQTEAQRQVALSGISANRDVSLAGISASVTMSKDDKALALANSNALYQAISGAYSTYLGRAPDLQGIMYWGEMFATGKATSYEDIRWAIANSAEGKAVAAKQAAYNASGVQQFVNSNQVYNDNMGFNTVDTMLSGQSATVLQAQETSRNAAIANVYREQLGREPDPAGLAYWSGTGLSIADISKNIGVSNEAINGYRGL